MSFSSYFICMQFWNWIALSSKRPLSYTTDFESMEVSSVRKAMGYAIDELT